MGNIISDQEVNRSKRRFLAAAATAMGGVATAVAAVPFVMSMMPSRRAKAAGVSVEVDIGQIEPGMLAAVEWQGKPVWIVNRTREMLDLLPQHDDKLRDPNSEKSQQPDYCKNSTRSIKPEYLVVVGICPNLGCSPAFHKEIGAAYIGADWPGGFICDCHGSRFDLAARVFEGALAPAQANLVIPPHRYLSNTRLLIGEDNKGGWLNNHHAAFDGLA